MKRYKRMSKGALTLFVVGAMATGGVVSIGSQAFAQSQPSSITSISDNHSSDEFAELSFWSNDSGSYSGLIYESNEE